MRLRRTILLGLGPLLSLWAMTPAIASTLGPRRSEQRAETRSFQSLFAPVMSLLILAAEHTPSGARHPGTPLHAVLGLETLRGTPRSGALWLLASFAARDFDLRAGRRLTLRC